MYNKFEKSQGQLHEQQEKYAAIMRAMWEQENTIMGVRFTWFTTLQGLLIASLGFSWKERVIPFIIILCLLGAIVSLSIMFVFRLGKIARDELQLWWKENLKDYKGPNMTGHIEDKMTIPRIFRPWRVLPPAFFLTWVATAIYAWFIYRLEVPNKKTEISIVENQQAIISSQRGNRPLLIQIKPAPNNSEQSAAKLITPKNTAK